MATSPNATHPAATRQPRKKFTKAGAERALVENTAILGFDRSGWFLGNSAASEEEQIRAIYEIAAALDAKSSYTLGHSRRVTEHARKVGEALGLSPEEITDLTTAAELHDIGNIQIPEGVLRKTGELSIEERDAIEAHVLLGARMVYKAGNDAVVAGIRHHHERWDGGGYPDGLAGSDIPMFARLIGIAEAYDAMTSARPYRKGFDPDHAIEVLRAESGSQFDPNLVEVFVSTLPAPKAFARRMPMLARQVHELQLIVKRWGALPVSATASTIIVALILGGTVLAPGTFDPPAAPDRDRATERSVDRVLNERVERGEDAVADTTGVDVVDGISGATSPDEVTSDPQDDGGTLVASVDGDLKFPDDETPGGEGPGNPPGNGNPPPGNGNGNPPPGNGNPPEEPGNGGGNPGNGGGNPGNGGGSPGNGGGNPGNGGGNPGNGGGGKPDDPGNGNGNGGGKPDDPGNGNGNGPPADPGNGNGNAGGNGGGKPDDPGDGNGNAGGNGGGKPDDPGNGNAGGPPADPGNGNGNGPPADPGNGNGNGNAGVGAGAGVEGSQGNDNANDNATGKDDEGKPGK